MSAFAEYGLQQTTAPARAHIVAIDLTHLTDSPELLGRAYALQEEAQKTTITKLTAKVTALEIEWDAARLAAKSARDAFHAHKREEFTVQNDANNATAQLVAANRLTSAWEQAEIDIYASKKEREARAQTVEEYRRKAEAAEKEAVTANAMQQAYYSQAEMLAAEYRAKQAAYQTADVELNQLRKQLEQLQAKQQAPASSVAVPAGPYGLIS
jgi:chromosome segregation ATPase